MTSMGRYPGHSFLVVLTRSETAVLFALFVCKS